jgi:hypothetical protein
MESKLSSSKKGLIYECNAESRSTYLNDADVRKPLVVSILGRSEELRFYNVFQNSTISTSGLKAVYFNVSPASLPG